MINWKMWIQWPHTPPILVPMPVCRLTFLLSPSRGPVYSTPSYLSLSWLELIYRIWQKWFHVTFKGRLLASGFTFLERCHVITMLGRCLSVSPENPEPTSMWVNPSQVSRKAAKEPHRILKTSKLLLFEISVYRMVKGYKLQNKNE